MGNRIFSLSLFWLPFAVWAATDNPGGSPTPPVPMSNIPEPGTWLLFATGAGALGLAKWWSSRKR